MKLHLLPYSPYARKVQMLLDLLKRPYEAVEVQYGDRGALARLTGGYIYVPVLESDDGQVITESRAICEHLLQDPAAKQLLPSPLQGPIWAYADFADGPLEDLLFRIASPAVRARWENPWERALYTLVKERKFGAGCVELWAKEQPQLLERARKLVAPSVSTLQQVPFLFGNSPTLADAALYGNLAMLEVGGAELVQDLAPSLPAYMRRLEAWTTQ
jgi:glutathione S-transferase